VNFELLYREVRLFENSGKIPVDRNRTQETTFKFSGQSNGNQMKYELILFLEKSESEIC
jgi:hypothetical protein